MKVEADTWYRLTLDLRFAESQEIDTQDPAWWMKLGELARGSVFVDNVDARKGPPVTGPEDDIHYGIGTGWTYDRDREGSR